MFDTNLTNESQYDIMIESKKVLSNLKRSKKFKEKDLFESLVDGIKNFDSGKDMYEAYDIIDFEGKSKVDMLYYDQLLKKIEETEQINKIQSLLVELTLSVKDVYEITNLKPEIYGRKIDVDILSDSIETTSSKLSKRIYEYLDRHFYKLNPKQRKEKYFNESKELSKKLITEGIKPEEAIEYSVKTVVMENFLKNIAFPFSVWSRINYLTECDMYSKVFDQQRLIESVEIAKNNINRIAKIVAAVI
jgi:hypothetical protein